MKIRRQKQKIKFIPTCGPPIDSLSPHHLPMAIDPPAIQNFVPGGKKFRKKWEKMAIRGDPPKNVKKCQKMAKNREKWPKMAKNGGKKRGQKKGQLGTLFWKKCKTQGADLLTNSFRSCLKRFSPCRLVQGRLGNFLVGNQHPRPFFDPRIREIPSIFTKNGSKITKKALI